jgi:hydroxymethylbilane synthase
MTDRRLVIGTRGSDLALWQANFITAKLAEIGCETEMKIIKTSGDKIQNVSFAQMEGTGFFTKEIEEALLAKQIDVAVHSLKDLMTAQPDGLRLGAVGFRADKRELLLIRKEAYDQGGVMPLKEGGIIGTSSARRQCQIGLHAPTSKIKDLRGNVPTRIEKLRNGEYDAIILAAAGVTRLGLDLSGLEAIYLAPELFMPAPAQGILGLQIRDDDPETLKFIIQLNSQEAASQVAMERGLLARFDSGCSLPLGVCSEINRSGYRLRAILGKPSGEGWGEPARADVSGDDLSRIVDDAYDALVSQ